MVKEINESLNGIEAIFLDLDGTIYLGDELIEGAIDFLNRLGSRGIARFFLSNNSSKSVAQYLHKLHGMGIDASKDEILLSTHDLLAWLSKEGVSKTYLVGTEGMREMLEERGLDTESTDPEFVVLGYDTEVTYEKLAVASVHLHKGVPMVSSHPDMVCPSPEGGLPDTGAYMALFEATTGVRPVHVCGKPNKDMILHKIEEMGLSPSNCAMVGDRLYTDMEMAERAGVNGILVLSGEATREDLVGSGMSPSLVVDSVSSLAT
ncbi:MAG: HAD-IIA family hydrolase [Candidatus Thalassarchaeaceae archaeon]|jgi:HAD superfamily hydrolase (TIGR01450 family)|nr:HAD-IIA family hydrolase [Candidatus Thalassarchaeaceae archaeon]MEE2629870.1 HAD-IIA family hydrolase [Candidatus Thermoplasmatota archaeon]